MVRKICVFCGSNKPKNNNEIEIEVKTLGKLLLDKKIDLVYGGAKIGLMGIIADTILLGGGYVTGIIPRILACQVAGDRRRPRRRRRRRPRLHARAAGVAARGRRRRRHQPQHS